MEPLVLYAPRVKIFQMHVSVFSKEPRIDQELNENEAGAAVMSTTTSNYYYFLKHGHRHLTVKTTNH